MRLDKVIKVIKSTNTSDGMGGFEQTHAVIAQLKAHATPVTAELALKEYGLVTTTAIKVIIKDNLPSQFDYMEIDNKHYRILQLSAFPKYNILLIEVIHNG